MAASKYYSTAKGPVKVQIETLLGHKGKSSGWVFDDNHKKHPGYQGDGYYFWRNETKVDYDKNPGAGVFQLKVYVAESGTYSLRLQGLRESNNPGDGRNDIWMKVDKDTSNALPKGELKILEKEGFAKFYKANSKWGYAYKLATGSHIPVDQKPDADFVLSKGFHTFTFAGRSQGYHVDFVTLFKKGLSPSLNAPDSKPVTGITGALMASDDDEPSVSGKLASAIAAESDDWETTSGGDDRVIDFGWEGGSTQNVGLRFSGLDLKEGATVEKAYFVFTAAQTSYGTANLDIEIENTLAAKTYTDSNDPDARSYGKNVDWQAGDWIAGNKYKSADFANELNDLIAAGGLKDSDALAFLVSGTGERDAAAKDAKLVITYDL